MATKTLDEFCADFGMVTAPGLDGSQTVDAFTGEPTNADVTPHTDVDGSDPAAVKAFLDDESVSDDVKLDAFLRTMLGGETDNEAIRNALRDYATATA